MKKLLFFLFFSILFLPTLSAQQKDYEWRIGVSGGYTNYYGDLSPYKVRGFSNLKAIQQLLYFNDNYVNQYSFKVSLEKQLSPTIGLMFNYGQYEFSMSDRYVKRDGSLLGTNRNFDRALNFQNQSRDMGLAFVFKTDNDRLLPATSLLAPYFTLGFGLIDFEVSGDLLDGDGNRYDYASGNVVNDGIYETNLYVLKTESDKGYDLGAFYTNLGLGIRLKLGPKVELFAQSDFIYTFSDHLDDVSGDYRTEYDNDFQAYAAKPGTNVIDPENPLRGDGKGENDWIIYHGIGLKFNFGSNKKSFKAPVLSTNYPDYKPVVKEIPLPETPMADTLDRADTLSPLPTGNNYTYYTNIQMVDHARMDSLVFKTQMLTWDQQIATRKSQILSGKMEENRLQQIQSKIQKQHEFLKADSLLNQNEKDSLVNVSEKILFDLRYSLDSLGKSDQGLQLEIDSIAELKKNSRMVGRQNLSDSRMDSLFNSMILVDTLYTPEKLKIISGSAIMERQIQEESTELAKEAGIVTRDKTLTKKESGNFESDLRASQQINSDFQERINALERKTRRLQSERDSLRALPRETIYLNNAARDVYRAERSTARTPRQTEVGVQNDGLAPAPERSKRKWWLLGGLFGGAAATKALTKDADRVQAADSLTLEKRALDSVSGKSSTPLEYDSINRMPFARGLVIQDSLSMKADPSFKSSFSDMDIRAPQLIRDTVFMTADPEIRLFKSKTEVFFKNNQKIPDEEQIKKLAPLVDFIKDNPEYSLSLTGFADNTGNVAYNLKLIQSRIDAIVGSLLNQFGLQENQIQTEIGGQVVRSPNRSPNDNDRKVEARIVLKD